MAKFNLQQFLLSKGEKVAMGLAIGGLGLLGLWGITNFLSAESPKQIVDNFNSAKKTIESQINQADGTAADLPPELRKTDGLDLKPVGFEDFRVRNFLFEPVDRPNRNRENPKVLGIVEAQLDLVRLSMKAFDIKGSPGNYSIGVFVQGVKISAADNQNVKDLLKRNDPKAKNAQRPGNQPPAVRGAAGGGGAAGNAGGGAQPQPPGGGGIYAGGITGADGGGVGGLGGAYGAGQFDQSRERYEKTVTYKPIDQFLPTDQPAFIVYPRRTILMHAVFPLKEQLEVVRRALRLKDIQEASNVTSGFAGAGQAGTGTVPGTPPGIGIQPQPGSIQTGTDGMIGAAGATTSGGTLQYQGPTFAGYDVERQVTAPNGTVYPWSRYDHVSRYLTEINNRKIADQPDEGYLPYFIRYDQEMAVPLPAVADGQQIYPDITLPAIVRTVNKMKAESRIPLTPTELQNRFQGKGNSPFLPSFLPTGGGQPGGAAAGQPGGDGFLLGGGRGVGIGPGGVPPGVPQGSGPGGNPGGPGGYSPTGYNPNGIGAIQAIKAPVELEHMMIRFLDVDILPGFSYEYRIRVKMKNPNFKRKDVSRPSDGDVEILYGPYVELKNADNTAMKVTVPNDLETYTVDPKEYAATLREKQKESKVVSLLDNANGKLPVIQVQQWMQQTVLDSKAEPVGAWVVGNIPVARGEFLGKRQLISLPLWSSQRIRYLLQELPKYKVPGAKEQPKGVLVDFTTANVCVDYEGGIQSRIFGERSIEDDGAVEMLIQRPDGSVFVRNSGKDMKNADRLDREKKWDDWIAKVKLDTANTQAPGITQPGTGTLFDKQ